jgi:hypothetical protein
MVWTAGPTVGMRGETPSCPSVGSARHTLDPTAPVTSGPPEFRCKRRAPRCDHVTIHGQDIWPVLLPQKSAANPA